jgi:ethanolamine transporter EutH
MFTVILRSVCVGIVAVLVGVPLAAIAGLTIATQILLRYQHLDAEGSVGWDLVTIAHNYPVTTTLFPLIVFAVGFLFGYRYFSRSLVKK